MKCIQKSCQRNKNINDVNGLCNVCNDVVKDTTKRLEDKKVNKVPRKKVEVDFAKMVKMHEKLARGESIDPAVISSLVLGGVINILVQHDMIEDLEAKLKELEQENKTNKIRIESLEHWMNKQSLETLELDKKLEALDADGIVVKENYELSDMKKKVISLEVDLLSMKSQNLKGKTQQNSERRSEQVLVEAKKSCQFCASTFQKNCDLEKHVKEEHESAEMDYKCDICNKEFYLEWRWKKHAVIHAGNVKYCHYYNNGKACPYEEIGCMFLHMESQMCPFKPCKNRMCEFQHEKQIETMEEESDDESEDAAEKSPINGKQCHLCNTILNQEENLVDHMETDHREYYNGMMEATAEMSSRS